MATADMAGDQWHKAFGDYSNTSFAALLRRKPVEVTAMVAPIPLDARPLVTLAGPSVASAEPFVVEPVPITWSTDWSSYQPAGIVAPSVM